MRELRTLSFSSARFEKSCACWSMKQSSTYSCNLIKLVFVQRQSSDGNPASKPWFLGIYGVYQLVPFVQMDLHSLWNYRFGGYHLGGFSWRWAKEDGSFWCKWYLAWVWIWVQYFQQWIRLWAGDLLDNRYKIYAWKTEDHSRCQGCKGFHTGIKN